MSTAGDIIAFQYDSISYEVAGEADFSEQAQQEIEGIPTSGNTLFKVKKKVPEIQSVDLIVDAVDKQTLLESRGAKPCSYTEADGTVNSGPARINIESRSTQENKMSLTVIPTGVFSIFPA